MSEIEVAVCPRCAQPFPPGSDYCTHCGGQLGIAETTLPYIPVPNSARFSDEVKAPPSELTRIRPVYRAMLIFGFTLIALAWGLPLLISRDGLVVLSIAVLLAAMIAIIAWVYFTWIARRGPGDRAG